MFGHLDDLAQCGLRTGQRFYHRQLDSDHDARQQAGTNVIRLSRSEGPVTIPGHGLEQGLSTLTPDTIDDFGRLGSSLTPEVEERDIWRAVKEEGSHEPPHGLERIVT